MWNTLIAHRGETTRDGVKGVRVGGRERDERRPYKGWSLARESELMQDKVWSSVTL